MDKIGKALRDLKPGEKVSSQHLKKALKAEKVPTGTWTEIIRQVGNGRQKDRNGSKKDNMGGYEPFSKNSWYLCEKSLFRGRPASAYRFKPEV